MTLSGESEEHGLLGLVSCQRCGLVEDDLEAAIAVDAGGEWMHPCPRCGSVLRDTFPMAEMRGHGG